MYIDGRHGRRKYYEAATGNCRRAFGHHDHDGYDASCCSQLIGTP